MARMAVVTTCSICLQELTKIRRTKICLPCKHTFCRVCLTRYARNAVYTHPKVKCPNMDCQQHVSLEGLVGHKWIQIANRQRRVDICPFKRCTGTLIDGSCNKCYRRICDQCGERNHPDYYCDPNVKANYQLIRLTTKPCPQCKVLIEKNNGCDHIKCIHCGYDFWWTTLEPYKLDQMPDEQYLNYDAGVLYRQRIPIPCIGCLQLCMTNNGFCDICNTRHQNHNNDDDD